MVLTRSSEGLKWLGPEATISVSRTRLQGGRRRSQASGDAFRQTTRLGYISNLFLDNAT